MGAQVLTMTPEQHDAAVAWSSHLPQLLSTTLSLTLSRAANPDVERVAGPGLMDMTRLALSSPDLWQSILETNRESVLVALNALIDQLTNVKNHLQEDGLVTLWRESSNFSRHLRRQVN
jgi:prephenate dehydrogenase